MFREPEGEKLVEVDHLASDLTNDYEVKMDVQKVSGAEDTSGPLSSANLPISVTSPKPLSSNIDSRSGFPTKIPSLR